MSKPYIIGIAGGSGAGKTRILKLLRDHFNDMDLCIISQDNYYRPANEQVRDENGELNFDRPEGIDEMEFLKDIETLSRNQPVIRTEYSFNQPGVSGNKIILKPAPVILVEGLFVFYFPRVKKILDYQIFIDSHHQTRLERRLERDFKERGLSPETIHYQWENHVVPAFEKFLLPYKDEADLIIENNGTIEKGVEKILKIIEKKINS